MESYDSLVKALRSASTVSTAWEKLMHDAAAAIEALQAYVKRMEDELRFSESSADEFQMQAALQNALLAKQLPKRSQWTNLRFSEDGTSSVECILCGATIRNGFTKEPNYCPNCGAKMMEVQE